MKQIFLIVFSLLGFLVSNARMYYYIRADRELSSSTRVSMMYVSGDEACCMTKNASEVSSKMYSDSDYWENYLSDKLSKSEELFVYDFDLSTSSFTVYKTPWRGQGGPIMTYGGIYGYQYSGEWGPGPLIGYYYRAISSDGRTIISWKQRKDSDEVLDKCYYEVIDPTVLNQDPHDFLR